MGTNRVVRPQKNATGCQNILNQAKARPSDPTRNITLLEKTELAAVKIDITKKMR